jgi:Fe-S-cluster containining protein
MVHEARRVGITLDKDDLTDRALLAARYELSQPRDRTRWFLRGLPCVFLGADNGCTIYARRPTICRVHHVQSDPKRCADPEGTVIKFDTRDTEQRAFARIIREHIELGMTPVYGPMAIMVREVMRGTPSYEVAKLRGCIDTVEYLDRDEKRADAVRSGQAPALASVR